MCDDSLCDNTTLQGFFTKPLGLAVPPSAVRVQETMAAVDQSDIAVEHVAMVTSDSGFMHDRDHEHIREQYPR